MRNLKPCGGVEKGKFQQFIALCLGIGLPNGRSYSINLSTMDALDLDLDNQDTIRGFAPGRKVFDRYILKKIVGRGGMGVVWQAEDETLDRVVALKFLPDIVRLDKAALNDLKNETNRCLELTHPNIVRIYDLAQNEESAAIAMEFVDGDTLASIRSKQTGGFLETEDIGKWLPDLGLALHHAHDQARIAHCDIKPANLMLSNSGTLKLTDFGISRNLTDSVTRISIRSSSGGTIAYMSPQQAMGDVPKVHDDIYAVGASLYELITSKPPFFSGDILAQLERRVPPSMTTRREEFGLKGGQIPKAWEAAVLACLEKDPANRPASVAELVDAIGANQIWKKPTREEYAHNDAAADSEIALDLDEQPTVSAIPLRSVSTPAADTTPARATAVVMTHPAGTQATSPYSPSGFNNPATATIAPGAQPGSTANHKKLLYAGIAAVAFVGVFLVGKAILGQSKEAKWAVAQDQFQSAYAFASQMASNENTPKAKADHWKSFLATHGEFANPNSTEDDKLLGRANDNVERFHTESVAQAARELALQEQQQKFDSAYNQAATTAEEAVSAEQRADIWNLFLEDYDDFAGNDLVGNGTKINAAKSTLASLADELQAEQQFYAYQGSFNAFTSKMAEESKIPGKFQLMEEFLALEVPQIPGKQAEVEKIRSQAEDNREKFQRLLLASAADTAPNDSGNEAANDANTVGNGGITTTAAGQDGSPAAPPAGQAAAVTTNIGGDLPNAIGAGTTTGPGPEGMPSASPSPGAPPITAVPVNTADIEIASRDELFVSSKYNSYGYYAKIRVLEAVQTKLKAGGHYSSSIDGVTGKNTHNAIIAYQQQAQLPVTGRLDDTTMNHLGLDNVANNNAAPPKPQSRTRSPSPNRQPSQPSGMPGSMSEMMEKMRKMGNGGGGFPFPRR